MHGNILICIGNVVVFQSQKGNEKLNISFCLYSSFLRPAAFVLMKQDQATLVSAFFYFSRLKTEAKDVSSNCLLPQPTLN